MRAGLRPAGQAARGMAEGSARKGGGGVPGGEGEGVEGGEGRLEAQAQHLAQSLPRRPARDSDKERRGSQRASAAPARSRRGDDQHARAAALAPPTPVEGGEGRPQQSRSRPSRVAMAGCSILSPVPSTLVEAGTGRPQHPTAGPAHVRRGRISPFWKGHVLLHCSIKASNLACINRMQTTWSLLPSSEPKGRSTINGSC